MPAAAVGGHIRPDNDARRAWSSDIYLFQLSRWAIAAAARSELGSTRGSFASSWGGGSAGGASPGGRSAGACAQHQTWIVPTDRLNQCPQKSKSKLFKAGGQSGSFENPHPGCCDNAGSSPNRLGSSQFLGGWDGEPDTGRGGGAAPRLNTPEEGKQAAGGWGRAHDAYDAHAKARRLLDAGVRDGRLQVSQFALQPCP